MAILSKRILFCVTHFSNFNQKKLFVDSANLKKYINYSKKRQIGKNIMPCLWKCSRNLMDAIEKIQYKPAF